MKETQNKPESLTHSLLFFLTRILAIEFFFSLCLSDCDKTQVDAQVKKSDDRVTAWSPRGTEFIKPGLMYYTVPSM